MIKRMKEGGASVVVARRAAAALPNKTVLIRLN